MILPEMGCALSEKWLINQRWAWRYEFKRGWFPGMKMQGGYVSYAEAEAALAKVLEAKMAEGYKIIRFAIFRDSER